MSSHTLKLHVENPGTPYSSSTEEVIRSPAGHAWFEVAYPDGTSLQSGFASKDPKSGTSSAPGEVFHDDGENYAGAPAFTVQYEITVAQAKTLERFSEQPLQFGFDTNNYHALTNSCVDFVWKALETIGMNPLKKQGDVLPIDNVDDFMRLTNPAMRPGLPSAFSWVGDAWDSLRPPAPFPMLPWEIAFEPEPPQGTINVGPLGPPTPVMPIDTGAATPPTPQPIAAPTWSGWEYGACLVWDDPPPGIDTSDHSLCKRFYSSASPSSRLSQPLFGSGDNGMMGVGRNEFSTAWLA